MKKGDNIIVMSSDVKATYRISEIELKIEYDDDSHTIEEFDHIWLEKRIFENVKLTEIDDLQIKNFVETKVKLDKDDYDEDLTLKFDADKITGRLIILANGKEAFDGKIDGDNNEITIEKRYLKSGSNKFKFIGVSS